MSYRATYKDEVDKLVLDSLLAAEAKYTGDRLADYGTSINDLRTRTGLKLGTVRNSLARLRKAGVVIHIWDGNQRYGRYVYARVD